MMDVKVYYEMSSYSELVATFKDEDTYMKCLPALEVDAKENNYQMVTESVGLDLHVVEEEERLSLSSTVAAMTHNMFDEVYEVSDGVSATYDKIYRLAVDFELQHRRVQWGETEEYLDWEECVIEFVKKNLKS